MRYLTREYCNRCAALAQAGGRYSEKDRNLLLRNILWQAVQRLHQMRRAAGRLRLGNAAAVVLPRGNAGESRTARLRDVLAAGFVVGVQEPVRLMAARAIGEEPLVERGQRWVLV